MVNPNTLCSANALGLKAEKKRRFQSFYKHDEEIDSQIFDENI